MNISKAIGQAAAAVGYSLGSIGRGFKVGASQGLQGRWEGFEMDRYRDRPQRRLASQDADMNFGTREGLLSEARALDQTYPIVQYILNQYANRCVGSCRLKWNTGDRDIDRGYAQGWQDWMPMAHVQGVHHFRKLTKLNVIHTLLDGDIFGRKVESESYGQLDMIEGDRVSAYGIYNTDSPDLIGGVRIDPKTGRRQGIRVWHRTLYGYFDTSEEIPWSQVLHVFDPSRIDATRGVTHFVSVLNKLRDLKETTLAEQLAAKRNSKLALLVKSVFGGAGKGTVNLFADEDDSRGGNTDKIRVQEINDVTDAYMFPQEDVKAHTSERPSDGWYKLMEWMVREIAIGLKLPFSVVWNMSGLGGPAARFEIGQANSTFMNFSNDVIDQRWLRPIGAWWLAKEIKAKRQPFHPNWYRFLTPRPASITIDMGRDSVAALNENRMGFGTATAWYAEEDLDFEDETDRLVYEATYRRNAIKSNPEAVAAGVVLEDIRMLTPNGSPVAAGKPEPDEDDKSEDGDVPVKKGKIENE